MPEEDTQKEVGAAQLILATRGSFNSAWNWQGGEKFLQLYMSQKNSVPVAPH